jgi:hypothetical protein
MTAIVITSLRGSTSARRLGLRTVSRFSSLSALVVDDVPAIDGDGDGRDFGEEPVQRIRWGVETSMFVEDESVEWIRTVHLDFCTIHISIFHTTQHIYDDLRYPQNWHSSLPPEMKKLVSSSINPP